MKKIWAGLLAVAGAAAAQPAWSANSAYIDSPDGDYIGQGQTYQYGSGITASAGSGGGYVSLSFGGWSLQFESAFSQPLAVGNYEGATRYPFNSSAEPGLSFSGNGRGCNQLSGWFEIHEITLSGGSVVAFAADFVQSCDGMPPLFGAVRINSAVPLQLAEPYARAQTQEAAEEGELVTLDGSASFDRGSAVTYQWQQTSGTPVSLTGATTSRAKFLAPDVASGGAELVFTLTVEDSQGNTDSTSVTVTVHDAGDLRTRAFFDSDAGDWVGQGLTYWYNETSASITTGPLGTSLQVNIDGPEQWTANFALPSGASWAPGSYADAQRYPFQLSTRPGLSFYGEGRGCNTVSGWFEIVELEVVGSTVLRLAVDFTQHCEGGTTALFGAIRINSNVPLDRGVPYAVAPATGVVSEGDSVTLDGSDSTSRSGDLSYEWTQTGGTPVTIQNATSAVAQFLAPPVAPGGETLTFLLTVTDEAGNTDTTTVAFHVADDADPRTRAYIDGQSGDWISGGQDYSFSAPNDAFAASAIGDSFISVTFSGWRAEFEASTGRTLAPGNFEGATRYPFNAASIPGLSISSPGRGCNQLTGWFEVHEAAVSGSSVTKLAVDFVQRCDGGPPLFGAIRINSAVPLLRTQPYARPMAPPAVTESEAVQLDGTVSFDRATGIASYSWTQLAGPAVELTGADTAQAWFMAPAVSQTTVLTFQLTVTDTEGWTDASTVSVTVYDASSPRTRAYLSSQPGDWVGQGGTYTYDEGTAAITSTAGNAVTVRIEGNESWTLNLALPQDASWQPGTYAVAQRYPFQSPTRPGLSFYGEGRGCNTVLGWFEIIEVQIVGNSVTKLAVDFRHHCEGGQPALFGAIRINSAVPLDRGVPYAIAGADIVVQEGQPIGLDGRWSYTPSGNPLGYAWTQTDGAPAGIADPGEPTTAIEPPAGAGRYEFQLEVTDGPGRTDVDRVVVVVRGRDEAQTYLTFDSDAGDYIGAGRHWFYSTDNANFTTGRNYDGGISTSIDGDAFWTLDLAPVEGTTFKVGSYLAAQRFPFQQEGHPGLSLSGNGRGCNTLTGKFHVRQLAFELDGSVRTAAVDFEQHCEGATPAVRGKLRINFRPDNEPLALAGADQDVEEGDTVVLDGSDSHDLQGPIGFAWRQTGGPPVELSTTSTAQPSFVAPAVAEGIAEAYTFALAVTDADGFTAEDEVRVRVFRGTDSDGDGVSDLYDAFPGDPDETLDTDGDAIGDNADTDDDGDGKPDSTEGLAPNGGDGDDDGTPDRLQANVATFVDMSGALVTLRVNGGTLLWAQSMSNPASESPAHTVFERGFFGFELLVTPGGAATVELWLHTGTAPQYYYKQGTSGLFKFDYNGATGAEIGANSIVLHFVDGARGDSDGAQNGHIVDPGAPAWTTGGGDSGGSGGGGSMPAGALLMLVATALLRRRRAH